MWLSRLVGSVKDVVFLTTIDACKFLWCCQDCRLKGCPWQKKALGSLGLYPWTMGTAEMETEHGQKRIFFSVIQHLPSDTERKKERAETFSVTRWKLELLFCSFMSVSQPRIRIPISMGTIMCGNWRLSTLEISLEYISSCKGPTLLTFNLSALSRSEFTSGAVLRISGLGSGMFDL